MVKNQLKDYRYWKNILNKEITSHETSMNFSGLFLHYIATDSVNKFDTNIKFSDTPVSKTLIKNDFATLYQKLGYKLSLAGSNYCLFALKTSKGVIINYADVIDYAIDIHKELVFIEFRSEDDFYMYEGNKTELYTKFVKEGDKVYKTNYIWTSFVGRDGEITKEQKEVGNKILVESTVIPAQLMFNNSLGFADIPEQARGLLSEMNIYMNQIRPEFEKSKIINIFNTIFNSEDNRKKFEKEIITKRGSSHEISDNDSTLADSMIPMNMNGNNSTQRIEQIFGFLDSRVREFSHQFRDHISGSAQTNEFELASYNQQAFEYMTTKMAFRKLQLEKFLKKVAALMGKKVPELTMELSSFEQNRIDSLQAKTDQAIATAEQARGIAEKNMKEAKLLNISADIKKTAPVEETKTTEVNTMDDRNDVTKEVQAEVKQDGE